MQKVKCLFKIFITFTGKTNDHINTNTTMWHQSFYQTNTFCVQFSFISSSHHAENFIASALQWNMKMWHELFTVCYKFYDLICKQIRFNRRDAITFNAFHFIQLLNKIKKIFLPFI